MAVSPAPALAVAGNLPANVSVRFGGHRQVSRHVALLLEGNLQRRLWQLIEAVPPRRRDRVQYFELSAGFSFQDGILQRIVHRQIAPPLCRELAYAACRPVSAKLVAVQDDAGQATLLAVEEWLTEGGERVAG